MKCRISHSGRWQNRDRVMITPDSTYEWRNFGEHVTAGSRVAVIYLIGWRKATHSAKGKAIKLEEHGVVWNHC